MRTAATLCRSAWATMGRWEGQVSKCWGQKVLRVNDKPLIPSAHQSSGPPGTPKFSLLAAHVDEASSHEIAMW